MNINSMVGPITIEGDLRDVWQLNYTTTQVETGVEIIKIFLDAKNAELPPELLLSWKIPNHDIQYRWHSAEVFKCFMPPNWAPFVESNLASQAPVMTLFNMKGENRLSFAISEAKRKVAMKAGVCELTNNITCAVKLFIEPEAPFTSYQAELRLDMRKMFYADTLYSMTDWFASLSEYTPMPVPDSALNPIYSTWYSYHQDLFDKELETECELAKQHKMSGIIVDDGWQTDDNNLGYAFCGDWEISKKRFPNMREHVEKIHNLGMKYLVWFSIPFVGVQSKAYDKFKGKYLYYIEHLKTSVLDPRFPEVREYLINIYENALREWNIDGFKLDFIDNIRFDDAGDVAIAENYAGRDIKALPEATDRLLSDIMIRLRAIKPDILIEFRQSYMGPAIRKYGNMLRAMDCPADIISNRVRTINLRLTSGNTAVHSDMLEWHSEEKVEIAALQLLNIIFSVPQISVKLEVVPQSHRDMLDFWLDFCIKNRDVLLKGYLKPYSPEENYPIVDASTEDKKVLGVYSENRIIDVNCTTQKSCFIVNATQGDILSLNCAVSPKSIEIFDTCGNVQATVNIPAGLSQVKVPAAGLLKLTF